MCFLRPARGFGWLDPFARQRRHRITQSRLFAPESPDAKGLAVATWGYETLLSALERQASEGFGDFCNRAILPVDATFHSIGTPVAA